MGPSHLDRLVFNSPAMQAVRQLENSRAMQAVRQLENSPAMRAVRQLENSPAMRAVRQLENSPAMQAVRQLENSPAMQAIARLQASPVTQAAAQALARLQASPVTQAAAQALAQLQASPVTQAAAQLRQAAAAAMPQLAPGAFGAAWNKRLAEAVGRLECSADIIVDATEPERARAIEVLAEDVVILQEAATTPEAQKWVNPWANFVLWLVLQLVVLPALAKVVQDDVLPVIMAPLVETTSPDPPPAPRLSRNLGAEAVSTALTLPDEWAVEGLPAIVERAGQMAAERVVEFFTPAQIPNPNTRAAYAKAVIRFFTWCDERGLELDQISSFAVAIYVEEMQDVHRAPTVRQHLAAIRRLFDWLVVGQVVPWNPTAAVRGPTHVVKRGKTPVLQPAEVRMLLDSIDTSPVGGLRDRALMGVMIYSFARVSAVVNMDVDDYYQQGKRWWLRLREKGGKHHTLPVHHKAEAYLDAYLAGAGIAGERGSPLWRSLTRTRELGERRMSRVDVFRMVKRRVKAADLGEVANCHTFRASGITAYLLNGGTLERAQAIAGHESPRTTQLYDRTADDITVEDIERIRV